MTPQSFCYAVILIIAFGAPPAVSAQVRKVPPLPRVNGREVVVNDVERLKDAIENARDNTTIRIADGTYRLSNLVSMRAEKNVTIRGASGDPTKVLLSGIASGKPQEFQTVQVFTNGNDLRWRTSPDGDS